ncbi:MAG: SH3 domain-containing protein [Deltaproteobacteria bacterium]|nr:SH3 domain-containing protein [Deltaproteobacteria bacterium]
MKQRRPTPAQGLAPAPSADEGQAPAGAAVGPSPARRPEALPDRARWERAFQAPLGWVQAYMGGPEAEEQLSGEVAVAADGRVYFRDRRPAPEVVAHEAAHLVQQRGGSPGVAAQSAGPAALEAEAQEAAAAALAGQVRPIRLRAGPGPQAFSRGRLLQGRNLRAAAAPTAPSLGELAAGSVVQVLDDSGPWWRVRAEDGREGWMLARNAGTLVFADAEAAPAQDGAQQAAPAQDSAQQATPAQNSAQQAAPAQSGVQQANPAQAVGAQGAGGSVQGAAAGAQQATPAQSGVQQATPAQSGVQQAAPGQRPTAPAVAPATTAELAAARAVRRPVGGGLRLNAANTLLYLKAITFPSGGVQAAAALTSTNDPALAGAAATLRAWAGQVQTGSFLGMRVTAHNELLARLAVAEAWLERTAQAQGQTAVQMFSPSEGQGGLRVIRDEISAHGLGLAIDINYASNPWVGGDNTRVRDDRRRPGDGDARAANAAFEALARHALEFSGLPAPANSAGHTDPLPRGAADHGAAWDQMDQLDNAIEVYFSMLGNAPRAPGGRAAAPLLRGQVSAAAPGAGAQIESFLRARGLSPTAAEVQEWERRLRADFQAQSTSATSNWVQGTIGRGAARDDVGVMNLQRELVVALCDVAGLRWGAGDFGNESGDIMHFDASDRVSLGPLSAKRLSERTRAFRPPA